MSFVRLGFSVEAWFTEALQGNEPEVVVVNRVGADAELAARPDIRGRRPAAGGG